MVGELLRAFLPSVRESDDVIDPMAAVPASSQPARIPGAGSAPANTVNYTSSDGTTIGMARKQWRAYIDGADTGTDV